MSDDGAATALHAAAVALDGAALLILGPSGSGKSALALDLIALGARLVADDVVVIRADRGRAVAAARSDGEGLIEARGIGLLRLEAAPPTPITLVLDLALTEPDRLPQRRLWRGAGASAPLLHRPQPLHPASILAALAAGGPLNPDEPLASGPPRDHSLPVSGANRGMDGMLE
ncbi:MAG: serine kinase [Pseudomonadota bacterium]